MKSLSIVAATLAGMLFSSSAIAASVKFTVLNSFGATITLDSASCTSSSISPPSSIFNGSTATFSSTTSGTTTLCTVRYKNGIYGCQFRVQISSVGAFVTANAYNGSGSRPQCISTSEGYYTSNGYQGTFKMY